MASESPGSDGTGFDGTGTGPPPVSHQPFGGPPMPGPPRPRMVTAASVLWISLGVLFGLGGLWALLTESASLSTGPLAPLLVTGFGVAIVLVAKRFRDGSKRARVALTVMGIVALIGIWTVVVVVPALVLQFRPDSSAWFDARARQDPPSAS